MAIRKPFCVKDVLQRPIFQEAKLVAGREGLNRPVRWVHVLEVTDAAELLHGEELILTTGVGLGRDESLTLQYVRGLIEKRVSGLCIELGKYFPEVPEGLRTLADASRFPIIVFERPVRFIDITQDIHAHLIDQHHDQLVQLERISRQFLQLTLRPQGLKRILELLYQETGCPVRLQEEDGELLVYPEDAKPETAVAATGEPDSLGPGQRGQPVLQGERAGETRMESRRPREFCQPILAMDTRVGELSVIVQGEPTEFLHLVLDRAATAIAQELLRRVSLEERRLRTTRRWMDDLLHRGGGRVPGTVAEHLQPGVGLVVAAVLPLPPDLMFDPAVTYRRARSSFEWQTEELEEAPWDSLEGSPDDRLLLRAARILPRVFRSYGFVAWLSPVGNHWAVIAADARPAAESPGRGGRHSAAQVRSVGAAGESSPGTASRARDPGNEPTDKRNSRLPDVDLPTAFTSKEGGPARKTDAKAMARFQEALGELVRRLASDGRGGDQGWVVGIGRMVFHPAKVPEAWRQATHALAAQMPASHRLIGAAPAGARASQGTIGFGPLTASSARAWTAGEHEDHAGLPERAAKDPPRISFLAYDDLYTWQLFLQMDERALAEFVDGQIGALLAHDRLHGTELVDTVRVFFACNQSKQQAAQALFIHRQTLYYRLEQIASLLGDGWNRPPRRLALEVAVDAARFLAARGTGKGVL